MSKNPLPAVTPNPLLYPKEQPESPGMLKSFRNKIMVHMINKLAKYPTGPMQHQVLGWGSS